MLNLLPQIKTSAFLICFFLTILQTNAQLPFTPNNSCYTMQIPPTWENKGNGKDASYRLPNGIIFSGSILTNFANAERCVANFKEANSAKHVYVAQDYDTLDGYVVSTMTTEQELKSGNPSEKFQQKYYIFSDQIYVYSFSVGAEASLITKSRNALNDAFSTFHFKTKEYYCGSYTAQYPVIWKANRLENDAVIFSLDLPGTYGLENIAIRKSTPAKSVDDEIKKQVKSLKGPDYKDVKVTDATFGGMPAKKVRYIYNKGYSASVEYYVQVKGSIFTVSYSYGLGEADMFEKMMASWEANSFKWN